MDYLTKELEDIRTRLGRIRDILDEQGLFEKADQTSVNDAQKLHDYWNRLVKDKRTVEESILKSAAERHGNMRGSSRAENANRSALAGAMAYEPGETTMRLVLPLASFDEQIAAMTRRIVQAADTLMMHNHRVLGPLTTDYLHDAKAGEQDRPSGALDRITERLCDLEGAINYLEEQTNRATGLA